LDSYLPEEALVEAESGYDRKCLICFAGKILVWERKRLHGMCETGTLGWLESGTHRQLG
jgi:hypothetical protein